MHSLIKKWVMGILYVTLVFYFAIVIYGLGLTERYMFIVRTEIALLEVDLRIAEIERDITIDLLERSNSQGNSCVNLLLTRMTVGKKGRPYGNNLTGE